LLAVQAEILRRLLRDEPRHAGLRQWYMRRDLRAKE